MLGCFILLSFSLSSIFATGNFTHELVINYSNIISTTTCSSSQVFTNIYIFPIFYSQKQLKQAHRYLTCAYSSSDKATISNIFTSFTHWRQMAVFPHICIYKKYYPPFYSIHPHKNLKCIVYSQII